MNSSFWRDTVIGKHKGMGRLLWIIQGVMGVFAMGNLCAVEITTMGGKDISGAFESVYAVQGRVQYEISGGSVINEDLRREPGKFEWKGAQNRQLIKGRQCE